MPIQFARLSTELDTIRSQLRAESRPSEPSLSQIVSTSLSAGTLFLTSSRLGALAMWGLRNITQEIYPAALSALNPLPLPLIPAFTNAGVIYSLGTNEDPDLRLIIKRALPSIAAMTGLLIAADHGPAAGVAAAAFTTVAFLGGAWLGEKGRIEIAGRQMIQIDPLICGIAAGIMALAAPVFSGISTGIIKNQMGDVPAALVATVAAQLFAYYGRG